MYLYDKKTIFVTFLKEMTAINNFSPHTIKAYETDFRQVFNEDDFKEKINEFSLLKKIKTAQVRWSELSPATRQRKAASMKSFLRWLYEKKIIHSPLQEKIEAPSVPKKIPHFLSIDEVLHLFHFLKNGYNNSNHENIIKNKYYLTLVYLLYGGGLRVSEACHLMWKNIRVKSSEILVFGKGKKERWVILPQKAMEALMNLPREGDSIWGPKGLTERKAFDWIRKLGQQAGLRTPLHPHALRHSYATHLISAGINLRALQELMGHASLTSTEKYLHLSMDQLARTLESHHPLGEAGTKSKNAR